MRIKLPAKHPSLTHETIGDRIEQRLKVLKRSASEVSKAAGFEASMIRNIWRAENAGENHQPRGDSLARLAHELKVNLAWLLTGSREMNDDLPDDVDHHIESGSILQDAPRHHKVRLVGYVGAGSAAHYYALADEDYEEVEPTEGASPQTVAVEIKGKSFGPLMDGWLVFYDDVRSPVTEDLIGEICVVGLADDRILLKQIARERDGSYTLLSNSNEKPIRRAQIEWAAKVTAMRRRRR